MYKDLKGIDELKATARQEKRLIIVFSADRRLLQAKGKRFRRMSCKKTRRDYPHLHQNKRDRQSAFPIGI